ncbi:hypothetical protein M3Y99_00321700 [Aphelenchoides fujianensis]|nr:hypothetical protein M3Y99_00321700 [Aphelenchoides fujianensis]
MEVDPMNLCPQCGRAIFRDSPAPASARPSPLQPTSTRLLPKPKGSENTCEDCHKKCSKNAIRCRPCHNKRVAKEKAERHAAGTPMKKRGPKRKNDSPYVKW